MNINNNNERLVAVLLRCSVNLLLFLQSFCLLHSLSTIVGSSLDLVMVDQLS